MTLVECKVGQAPLFVEMNHKEIDMLLASYRARNILIWTNGVFDMLHTGHNHLFRFCKEIVDRDCNTVIVGVNSDESTKSLNKTHPLINNEIDRATMVIANQDVDFVVIFDEPNPIACMELIKPDYFVKGGDYTIEDLPENEKAVIEAYGGKVLVSGNVEGRSTTNIYKKIFDEGFDKGIDHANYMMVESDSEKQKKIPNYIMTDEEIDNFLKGH